MNRLSSSFILKKEKCEKNFIHPAKKMKEKDFVEKFRKGLRKILKQFFFFKISEKSLDKRVFEVKYIKIFLSNRKKSL